MGVENNFTRRLRVSITGLRALDWTAVLPPPSKIRESNEATSTCDSHRLCLVFRFVLQYRNEFSLLFLPPPPSLRMRTLPL